MSPIVPVCFSRKFCGEGFLSPDLDRKCTLEMTEGLGLAVAGVRAWWQPELSTEVDDLLRMPRIPLVWMLSCGRRWTRWVVGWAGT